MGFVAIQLRRAVGYQTGAKVGKEKERRFQKVKGLLEMMSI